MKLKLQYPQKTMLLFISVATSCLDCSLLIIIYAKIVQRLLPTIYFAIVCFIDRCEMFFLSTYDIV